MALRHLQQLIIERIQREGPLTFAEYMRMALYEPHYGYYMTGSTNIGFEGADFYTSTDVSSTLFANCCGPLRLREEKFSALRAFAWLSP